MSNTSRNIRGILAVAALTVGVSWTVSAPASAGVVPCHGRDVVEVLGTPGSVASACGEVDDVRATAFVGETETPARGEVPMAMEKLARIAGLPGLSRASAVVSFADAGGVAAGTGFHALPFGLPGFPGLTSVDTLATMPDLPGLPGTPGTGLSRFQIPTSPVGDLTDPTGALSGDTPLPLSLPHPVSVKSTTDDLPAADLPITDLPAADLPSGARPEAPAVPEIPAAGTAPLKVMEGTAELPVLPRLGLD